MAMLDAMPLIKLPTSWPLPVVATLCMAALAGLDLVGAFAAKEWAEKQNTVALGLGALSFLVLFWVYASSLQYAELAVVTMGWIVLLQVGILRHRPLPLRHLAADRQAGRGRHHPRGAGLPRPGARAARRPDRGRLGSARPHADDPTRPRTPLAPR